MGKIEKSLVKCSWPWPIGKARPLFPETEATLIGPTSGSPEATAQSEQNEKLRNAVILSALRMAGIGLLGGGSLRLLQEGIQRFSRPKDYGETEPTVEIHEPKKTKSRAVKHAAAPVGTVKDSPWYYPSILGGLALGLYGGYHGVRNLADKWKDRESEEELEAARKEFEDVLDEQYAQSHPEKFARLNDEIARAYERWSANSETVKQADWGSTATGIGIGTAALIWLLSHQAAYSRAHKSDPEAFRKKVLEYRRRVRQAASPAPVVFDYPEAGADIEDETEDKVAALKERIPGGKAEGKNEQDIAHEHDVPEEQISDQMDRGEEIEKEHSPDSEVAREIARDHLVEDPKYYKPHLDDMEANAKSELEHAGPEPLDNDLDEKDVAEILRFVAGSSDLDDTKLHAKFQDMNLYAPEGEETVYAVLQQLLQAHGDEVDPADVKALEEDEDASEAEEAHTGDDAEADQDQEDTEGEEKSAAAVHSCGQCLNFNGGTCAKQDEVKKAVGEDNLMIYLSNPAKTNSCPVFESQPENDTISPVTPGEPKSAAPIVSQLMGLASGVTDAIKRDAAKDPAIQQKLVGAATQAAANPTTLEPAATAMANNSGFQRGMNDATLQQAQNVPVLGSLFGK